MTQVLKDIEQLLDQNEELRQRVNYNVRQKGHKERARLERLSGYQGPDEETLHLLHKHRTDWLETPWLFWSRSWDLGFAYLDPQAQIIGVYLQDRHDDA